jgi:hypothetical protein
MRTQTSAASGSMPVSDGTGDRTTLGTWVKAALLTEAGFDLKSLDSPTARCPLTQTGRLWRIAMAATGDPAFGSKVASHIKPIAPPFA